MYLREAELKDKELLYQWINDSQCHMNSLNSVIIPMKEHEKWLSGILNSGEKELYILEQDETSIGKIYIEKQERGWRISFSIAKEFLGMGYGKTILQMLENKKVNEEQDILLYSEVKKDDIASQRIFESLEYNRNENDECCVYTKQRLERKKLEKIYKEEGILLLSNNRNSFLLYDWLCVETQIYFYSEQIDLELLKKMQPKFIISYNYKYIIDEKVIKFMQGNIINLHISYLPWNRGASPNFWSFIDDTPKGVTIHYINKELDRGAIIVQKEIVFNEEEESFESSYNRLNDEIIVLFQKYWKSILENKITPYFPKEAGTYHSKKELEQFHKQYPFSWNEKISEVKARWKG